MARIFAFAPFNSKYVKQITPNDPPSSRLSNNPKLWPFFRPALGAIDGSHIHATARAEHREGWRNRKGFISQNCLFCCSFDFLFTYVLTGWEGSASDARVYESAISDDLIIPEGSYLLADAGFPHCKELLVPYRGVRYHLAEWGRATLRYVCLFRQGMPKFTKYAVHKIKRSSSTCAMLRQEMSLSAFLELSRNAFAYSRLDQNTTYRSRHKFQQHCVHYTILFAFTILRKKNLQMKNMITKAATLVMALCGRSAMLKTTTQMGLLHASETRSHSRCGKVIRQFYEHAKPVMM